MLVDFFMQLRQAKVPVTIREYLSLIEALDKQVVWGSVEDFYYLARLCLVKDESHFDKFDRVFAQLFQGGDRYRRRAQDAHPRRMAAQADGDWSSPRRRRPRSRPSADLRN